MALLLAAAAVSAASSLISGFNARKAAKRREAARQELLRQERINQFAGVRGRQRADAAASRLNALSARDVLSGDLRNKGINSFASAPLDSLPSTKSSTFESDPNAAPIREGARTSRVVDGENRNFRSTRGSLENVQRIVGPEPRRTSVDRKPNTFPVSLDDAELQSETANKKPKDTFTRTVEGLRRRRR